MTVEQIPPVVSNPFIGLLRSRKFWLALLDVLISTALFFIGKYAGAATDDLKFLIAAYQPVIVMVIIGITQEDKAKLEAHAEIQVARVAASIMPIMVPITEQDLRVR